MTTLLDQTPIHMEAEQAMLGAMMSGQEFGMRVAIESLDADDFFGPIHQTIFRALRSMHSEGIGIDIVTIIDRLKRETVTHEKREVPGLDYVGGPLYITTLMERTPVVANCRAYAKAIRDMAARRRLVSAGHEIASTGYEGKLDTADAIDAAAARVIEVREAFDRREDRGLQTGESFAGWYVTQFYADADVTPRVPFPLPRLNQHTSGGQAAGWVVVTGGYSNEGKSWWGLDTMEAFLNSDSKGRGLYVSGEMPRDELWERLVAMGTPGTPYSSLQERSVDAYIAAEDRVEWIGALGDRLDVIDDEVSVDRIATMLATERMRGRPYRYVVIDHLLLLDLPAGRDDMRVKLGRMLKQIKRLAIRHRCTIHVLSQLKRPQGGASQVPTMHDFKETGDIENIADVALLLHRERDGAGDPMANGTMRVGKNRAGAFRGPIEVTFKDLRFREGRTFLAGAGLQQQQRAPRVVA